MESVEFEAVMRRSRIIVKEEQNLHVDLRAYSVSVKASITDIRHATLSQYTVC